MRRTRLPKQKWYVSYRRAGVSYHFSAHSFEDALQIARNMHPQFTIDVLYRTAKAKRIGVGGYRPAT